MKLGVTLAQWIRSVPCTVSDTDMYRVCTLIDPEKLTPDFYQDTCEEMVRTKTPNCTSKFNQVIENLNAFYKPLVNSNEGFMVSFTPTEVNGRTLHGTFIASFSFWYSGLTLRGGTLLFNERKLGENKQKWVEIPVRQRYPFRCSLGFFFPKMSYFCTNNVFWKTWIKITLAIWGRYCVFCYFAFSLYQSSYFDSILACKESIICISVRNTNYSSMQN